MGVAGHMWWSRSLVARMMLPIGVMLALVLLLGAVSAWSRTQLRDAYAALRENEEVRYDLSELRSLSRSLQRDALNFVVERDRIELAVLHAKFGKRAADMRARLTDLRRDAAFNARADHAGFYRTQYLVLDRLNRVAATAARGDRIAALALFRAEVRPNERAASRIADELIDAREAAVVAALDHTRVLEARTLLVRLATSVILFFIAAATTLWVLIGSVLRPLADIERAMQRIAAGEAAGETPHVARPDEIGRMARAIEVFRAAAQERERLRSDNEQARTDEVRRELEAEQARRRAERADAERSRAIADSVAALEAEVAQVLQRLRASAGQMAGAAAKLNDHSASAAARVDEVEQAVARAAGGATDIAAATDQFMTSLDGATASTRHTAGLSADVAAHADELAARMARVREDAQRVGAVVDLIHDIARRTNLLALNATIEASRAGEVGRGFAVVAGEVKALAMQTARETDDVAGQIADMQVAAHEAGETLAHIVGAIEQMAAGSRELAAGFAEQAASGQAISRNVTGAAQDLDVIGHRLADLSAAAEGVDTLSGTVRTDAALVQESAAMLDKALSAFFARLHAAGQDGTMGRAA